MKQQLIDFQVATTFMESTAQNAADRLFCIPTSTTDAAFTQIRNAITDKVDAVSRFVPSYIPCPISRDGKAQASLTLLIWLNKKGQQNAVQDAR